MLFKHFQSSGIAVGFVCLHVESLNKNEKRESFCLKENLDKSQQGSDLWGNNDSANIWKKKQLCFFKLIVMNMCNTQSSGAVPHTEFYQQCSVGISIWTSVD